jgi:hypothetical protein
MWCIVLTRCADRYTRSGRYVVAPGRFGRTHGRSENATTKRRWFEVGSTRRRSHDDRMSATVEAVARVERREVGKDSAPYGRNPSVDMRESGVGFRSSDRRGQRTGPLRRPSLTYDFLAQRDRHVPAGNLDGDVRPLSFRWRFDHNEQISFAVWRQVYGRSPRRLSRITGRCGWRRARWRGLRAGYGSNRVGDRRHELRSVKDRTVCAPCTLRSVLRLPNPE